MSSQDGKDPQRVIAGLKAAAHNPHVSEEAKEQVIGRLYEMGVDIDGQSGTTDNHTREKNPRRQIGGYKATLTNPTTSVEAKAHALEILEVVQEAVEEREAYVMAGYKAAISNPAVGESAKQHAAEVLAEHDPSA